MTGVEQELKALYDADKLWSFEKAWTTAGYDQLGLTADHEHACRQDWQRRVLEWNQIRNAEDAEDDEDDDGEDANGGRAGKKLPTDTTDIPKTFGYCALCMLPPSLVCFDDPVFASAFQQLDRNERRAINILTFYQTGSTVELDGVHSLAHLTVFPIFPAAWTRHNAVRYQMACYRYTIIVLRRHKKLPALAEDQFKDWDDTDESYQTDESNDSD